MSYNPSSLFSRESYAQYGRSRGASKPTVSKPKSTGLGSRQYSRKTTSKPTQTKSTWESLKERISNLIGDSGGDNSPKPPSSTNAMKVYERKEFNIKPVDVSVSTLPDSPKTDASPFESPVMRPQSPTNNRDKQLGRFSRPTAPSSPNIDMSKPKGLMSPTMGSVPSTSTGTVYKIKSGDTLSAIADKFDTSVEILARDNNIKDIDKIQAGKTLKVPLYGMNDDPDRDFSQSGVPLDQRDYAPEGAPFEAPEMTPAQNLPGNNIDFDFISDQEGEGINTGYVPARRNGTVIGNSGVTVGTGVDLGSKNDAYFAGLDESLKAKLRPHYGKRKAAAQASLRSDPLNLTDAEVDALDRHVKEKELDTLRTRWNQDSDTDFDDLPTNQATAVASTYYHHGNQMFGYNYWTQTTSGDWQGAADNLRDSFDRDPIFDPRRQREADYLEDGEM